jgi:hypothetical protein
MTDGEGRDLGAIARSIIDSNLYMTLGTADEDGNPWVSPVYYRPRDTQSFTGSRTRRRGTRETSRSARE